MFFNQDSYHNKIFELETKFWPFFLLSVTKKTQENVIFISNEDNKDIYNTLKSGEKSDTEILYFNPLGINLYDFITPNIDTTAKRMSVLYKIINNPQKKLIITSLDAVIPMVIPKNEFEIFEIKKGDSYKMAHLIDLLLDMGYKRENIVSDPGDFAVRGGILDIFSPSRKIPFRLDFFGEEIDNIRFFSPDTQRTIYETNISEIILASETPLNSRTIPTFKNHIKNFNVNNEIFEKIIQKIAINEIYHFLPFFYKKLNSFFEYIKSPFIIFEDNAQKVFDEKVQNIHKTFEERRKKFKALPFPSEFLIKGLDFSNCCFLTECNYDLKREVIPLEPLDPKILDDFSKSQSHTQKSTNTGSNKKSKTCRSIKKLNSFFNMEIGDYLIHESFGIGRYLGCSTFSVDNIKHDFISIEYLNNDKLHVPVENLELVSKYADSDTPAVLDKLGSTSWQLRKAKIKKRITETADELLRISAIRALSKSNVTISLDDGYDNFCKKFPYIETDDQLNAISDVVNDLTSGNIMDRLICGDVGFGKTEVSLRASYLIASSGKQVAFICPTTILCDQHKEVFQKRFKDTPIITAAISRMISKKYANEIKEKVADGKIDILIGTHSIFSTSINFKNLGLLVIDEEQHFGVKQKEQLKNSYPDTHILTLSATPIPRTLQFAINNIKKMSLISKAPFLRKPVKTFTLEFDKVVIKEALKKEMARNGLSFIVAPRMEDLNELFETISKLVPEAKIAILHGKLTAKEIYSTMHDFMESKFNILISTNIIESGIDIPNANTIIVYRADMFGISQLYQLRGRVGRSDIQSFAYFCVNDINKISEPAKKRLSVLKSIDKIGYGSFSLAMSDLDIRGAGNALGEEQSGNIKEVGFALYQKMLRQAIELAQNSKLKNLDMQVTLNLGIPVFIPSSYIEDLSLRLFMYKRISDLDEGEVEDIKEELCDRFGEIPKEVLNLLSIVKIKIECKKLGIEKIDAGAKGITLTIAKNTDINLINLEAFLNNFKGKIIPQNKIFIPAHSDTENVIKNVSNLIKHLRKNAIFN